MTIRSIIPFQTLPVTPGVSSDTALARGIDCSAWDSLVGVLANDALVVGAVQLGSVFFAFRDERGQLRAVVVNMTGGQTDYRVPVLGPIVDITYVAPAVLALVPATIDFAVALTDVSIVNPVPPAAIENRFENLALAAGASQSVFADAALWGAVQVITSVDAEIRTRWNLRDSLGNAPTFGTSQVLDGAQAAGGPVHGVISTLLVPGNHFLELRFVNTGAAPAAYSATVCSAQF